MKMRLRVILSKEGDEESSDKREVVQEEKEDDQAK
jgi:hypothetical protein